MAKAKKVVKTKTEIKRVEGGKFAPGVCGNPTGRPVGSKNHISKEFREMSFDAFMELGGKDWIMKVAKTKKNQAAVLNFFKALMPKDINIESEKPIPVLIIESIDDDEDPEAPSGGK